jgi:hypothetical protein
MTTTSDPRPAAVRAGPPPTPPSPPTAEPPGPVKLQVARYLGLAAGTEAQLLDALVLVAERHERDYEISRGATTLAVWTRENLLQLEPHTAHYGSIPSEHPEMLRAALLGGTRVGIDGTLADLCDLSVLAERAAMVWTIVHQGARELRDAGLQETASRARDHNHRQIAWIKTQIDHLAPDALSVPLDPAGQVRRSMPKRLDAISSIPDPVWAPLAAAGSLLVVGALGVVAGLPLLGPSLGPSAALYATMPSHPASRAWNTIVGHAGGVAAGFAGIALAGAADAPVVLQTGELTTARMVAGVIAVLLTVLAGMLLRASHPPAAATTLLVALGSVATLEKAATLMAGVIVLAVIGELVRRVRLQRVTPGERRAPDDSVLAFKLRRG